jgi:UDP-N-acetylglucosamine--N-acetylmuramyl-(pentapeptide) pyrophosphoryl-undecaprenol N-acetylglucosamine transferase
VPLALEPKDGGAPTRAALAWRTGPAVMQARAELKRRRADVLLGLGGYTSLPAVLAARSLGLPVALLEVNARPGTATRWLGRLADVVLYVWPEDGLAEDAARPRRRCIGPPLGPRFLGGAPDAVARGAARAELGLDPGYPVLLVLGGSQGALSLNRFVRSHVQDFVGAGVQVVHQTGPGRGDAAAAVTGYHPTEYIERVDRALTAATVVLCRGGASTLAEVAALRRPAFVVPYPHHKDRHQEHNARALGSGVRIVRDEALDARLCHELVRMCLPNAGGERRSMSDALERAVPIGDTRSGTARLYNELCDLSSARRA